MKREGANMDRSVERLVRAARSMIRDMDVPDMGHEREHGWSAKHYREIHEALAAFDEPASGTIRTFTVHIPEGHKLCALRYNPLDDTMTPDVRPPAPEGAWANLAEQFACDYENASPEDRALLDADDDTHVRLTRIENNLDHPDNGLIAVVARLWEEVEALKSKTQALETILFNDVPGEELIVKKEDAKPDVIHLSGLWRRGDGGTVFPDDWKNVPNGTYTCALTRVKEDV